MTWVLIHFFSSNLDFYNHLPESSLTEDADAVLAKMTYDLQL